MDGVSKEKLMDISTDQMEIFIEDMIGDIKSLTADVEEKIILARRYPEIRVEYTDQIASKLRSIDDNIITIRNALVILKDRKKVEMRKKRWP